MRRSQIAKVDTKTDYIKFQGGLDLESPALSVHPGALLSCRNYEANYNGGYCRIDGYERYDGRPAPSDSDYIVLFAILSAKLDVGDVVIGNNSAAQGTVISIADDRFCVSKVSGSFQEEIFNVGGTDTGTITHVIENGEDLGNDHAQAKSDAADLYRNDILAPTGSGPIRGLALLNGSLFAFRNNTTGTAGKIFKATASGWSEITLYKEIRFVSGVEEIADGVSVTQLVTGATAIVKRTVLESGTWGTDAAGRLILSNITGTFNMSAAIQVASVTKVTSASSATQITILPGGRYETIAYNFKGTAGTKRIYGCDGVNRGFEFDGDVYIPINTGMDDDTPDYVFAHQKQLFFSFDGSSQNSGVGVPYQWTALSGAAEIGLGDIITGYLSLTGEALAIFSRNTANKLTGTSVDDFALDSISDEVGCIPRTAQKLGYAYCLDDRGVIKVYPTDSYGNFDQGAVSRHIQPLIDVLRGTVVASTTYKTKNQYRLFCDNGRGICMTVLNKGVAFTEFLYPDNVACAISGEDSTGKDVVFFGSDEGMVYQADKGTSFDGQEIEAFLMLQFNNSKSPSTIKTYRKATIEMTVNQYSAIRMSTDFSYSDIEIPSFVADEIEIQGAGGYWDISNWDEFFFGASSVASPSINLEGTGVNIGLIVYSNSKIDAGHKIDGALLHYTPRRLNR